MALDSLGLAPRVVFLDKQYEESHQENEDFMVSIESGIRYRDIKTNDDEEDHSIEDEE